MSRQSSSESAQFHAPAAPLDDHDNAFLGLPMIPLAELQMPAFFDAAFQADDHAPLPDWAQHGALRRPPVFGHLTSPELQPPTYVVARSHQPDTEPDDGPIAPTHIPMPPVPQGPVAASVGQSLVGGIVEPLGTPAPRSSRVEALAVYLAISATVIGLVFAALGSPAA